MKEEIEFRMHTDLLEKYLPELAGGKSSYGITRVRVSTGSQIYLKIGHLYRKLRESNQFLFSGRSYTRKYSPGEIEAAVYFKVDSTRTIEPAAEECGTQYMDSRGCPECGALAERIGPMKFKTSHIPSGVDFVRTIADELIVSKRLRCMFNEFDIQGAEFRPIENSKGISEDFYEFVPTRVDVPIHPSTLFGVGPFDSGPKGDCSSGHLLGLNILSPVTIHGPLAVHFEVAMSDTFVGVRRGLLRPYRILLFSKRLFELVKAHKLKGFAFEVASVLT